MSTCHSPNACYHVDGEFCDRCYKPTKVSAMSGFEKKEDKIRTFCIGCNHDLDKCKCIWSAVRDLQAKVEDEINSRGAQVGVLHKHIEKINDMINMEDRITASDVLCRLTKLESIIQQCFDANPIAKIYERFNALEKSILEIRIQFIDQIGDGKKPHKCPVCEGEGVNKNKLVLVMDGVKKPSCNSCDGTGMVWG